MLIEHPCQIRSRLRQALCHLGRMAGTVYRPDRDQYGGLLESKTEIGRVMGYEYSKAKASGAILIALPGQLDEQDQAGKYLMVLYGSKARDPLGIPYHPPDTQKDDLLVMDGGASYRITQVAEIMGAYHLYALKEM